MFPVATTLPAVIKLPPLVFPVAVTFPVTVNGLSTSKFVPFDWNVSTPPDVSSTLPPELEIPTTDVPFAICVTATFEAAVTLDKNPPSPTKKPPRRPLSLFP